MITNKTTFLPELPPFLPEGYSLADVLFFDIETTGLSAKTSYVYLIGVAELTGNDYQLTQWICEEPSEEKELIRIFFDKASTKKVLLHYNGSSFDIPFLQRKAERHHLTCPLSELESLDLFTVARSHKAWFSLPDLKLKTMERFFSLRRTNVFGGDELIGVNAKFLGFVKINQMTNGTKKEEEQALLHVLLLHNAEDIMNLPALTILYQLERFPMLLATSKAPLRHTPEDTQPNVLSFALPLEISFPHSFTLHLPYDQSTLTLSILAGEATCTLTIPLVSAEYKLFYENTADYYYLPEEDVAIHRSIGDYLAKDCKRKATKATCYTRHSGHFLPFAEPSILAEFPDSASKERPCMRAEYKSKYYYTPYHDAFFEEDGSVWRYLLPLITALFPPNP